MEKSLVVQKVHHPSMPSTSGVDASVDAPCARRRWILGSKVSGWCQIGACRRTVGFASTDTSTCSALHVDVSMELSLL